MKYGLALVILLLAACNGGWQMAPVFQPQGPTCPPEAVGQAQWVQNNLTRVRLGSSRKEALGVVGLPAHVESFLLADNSAVDVLFYHTPETVCRAPASAGLGAGLLPLVFQNDRLLGYGQGYYQNMVVPSLRQPLGLPLSRRVPEVAAPSGSSTVGRGTPLR